MIMMVINNSKERRLAWSYSPTTTGGGGGDVKSVLFNINWTGLWSISLSRQHQL